LSTSILVEIGNAFPQKSTVLPPVPRFLRGLVASLPCFRREFGNVHPFVDELRDFKDFDDEDITTLREFISVTESYQALAFEAFQQNDDA
jgi:hypothetical protein